MNRPIKFRAWDSRNKIMHFADFLDDDFEKFPGIGGDAQYIVMQFTGLLDCHGKDIYEGDIIRQTVQGHEVVAPMIWNTSKAQFGLDATVEFDSPPHIEINIPSEGMPEIIGNIYENPELLINK